MRRLVAAFLVLLALAALSCADLPRSDPAPVAFTETEDEPLVDGRPGGTFRFVSPEPTAIDPSNADISNGITPYLFTGLVQVSAKGEVSAGVATDWRSSADCSQWSFVLRKGTRFHNGEEVTSASFKRGWERAATGKAAYFLWPFPSVDVSDPYLFGVTLPRPDCEFPQRMIQPAFSPVPSTAGPAGNEVYNDLPIGNGPFKMDGPWRHDRGIRLVRSENYTVGRKANLAAVEVTISVDHIADSYNGFRAGTVDWVAPPFPEEARSIYRRHQKLIFKRGYGTTYLLAMTTTKPLDSATARKAISLAIDRDAITRNVLREANITATSLTPPLFSSAFQAGVCGACRHDPAEAKRLARDAGLIPGTVLHFAFNDDGDQESWTATIKRQLETTLGLTVNYYGVPFKALRANWAAYGASGIFRGAWGADYPSPGNVLTPLLSTSSIGTTDPTKPATGDNPGRYSNPRVDRLLDEARTTMDVAVRMDLYRQAERIAIGEDLALIPLWYRQEYRLVDSDRFTNLRMNWGGTADLSVISLR